MSSSEVEEIKNRISIVDLIGEYIRLVKAGSNWKALCPFHNEKTPSFMVSEERRSFHCFGCQKGGDIFTFVMEMEGLDFREALERLAEKAGVKLSRFERDDWEKESIKPKLYNILELAAKWYEKNLWEGKGKEKILKYLHERGLTDESIRKFRLGYAPEGWRNILEFLLKRNYRIEDIAKTGLLVERIPDHPAAALPYQGRDERGGENSRYYDRFRDRIMFPIQDTMGRVVGFSARVAPGGDEKTAKYVNTPQTELYDKSKILYGLNLAKAEIKKKNEAILVEGNMDVIASHQAGFSNTVAVSGTALTFEQVKIIKRYAENLKAAFDMDAAGQAAAKKAARICLENDLDVRIVLLPTGKDAAEILKNGKKVWEEALQQSRNIIEYYFEDVFSRLDVKKPTEKKRIAKEILNVIKDIADPIEKAHWIKVLAEKLEVGEKLLVDILKKTKKDSGTAFEKKENMYFREPGKERAVEKRIIGLLAAFPKETERQRAAIDPSCFFGETEKKIIEKIISRRETDFKRMEDLNFDFESQRLIDEAVFEVEMERSENRIVFPEEELKKTLKRQKNLKLREVIGQISRKIKEAEKTGNKKAAKKYLEEFQNLSAQLNE